jgi:hypothetical protein
MPNFYGASKQLSYFSIPDRLLQLRLSSELQNFHFEFWLFIHCRMQHQSLHTRILLTGDQISSHPLWCGRTINAKEVSRARSSLKKLGLLDYRKDGVAYWYFVTHPVTGKVIDAEELALQAKEEKAAKSNDTELAKAQAEIARMAEEMAKLKSEAAKNPMNSHIAKNSVKIDPRKEGFGTCDFEDTGAVEEGDFIQ